MSSDIKIGGLKSKLFVIWSQRLLSGYCCMTTLMRMSDEWLT